MKISVLSVVLPVLVQSAAVPLERRHIQFGTIAPRDDKPLLGDVVPLRKAFKIEEIPAKSGVPGAKRIKAIYGPFRVRGPGDTSLIPGTAYSMDKGGTAYNFRLDSDFPRDITVLLATSALMSKDMKPATLDDKVYNHHTAFMETVPESEQIYTCENTTIVAKNPPPIHIFAGATSEKVDYDFISRSPKVKTGFYIKKDALLQNMIDLVNFGPTAEFYSDNEIEYLPGLPAGYLKSKQTMINPDICGGLDGYALHAPVGQQKYSVESNGVIMKESGWLVRQRGHLHDGGTDMTLEVNGKLICKSLALYGGPGGVFKGDDGKTFETITQSTECEEPVLLHKGDKIKLVANFDLDKHPSRPMGAAASSGASGHAGMAGMKNVANMMDGGEAEQMAIMFIYFAKIES